MSNDIQANRDRLDAVLRDPNSKQCFGGLNGPDGSHCAVGWAKETFGFGRYCDEPINHAVGARAVLPMMRMNDIEKLALPEIADRLRDDVYPNYPVESKS